MMERLPVPLHDVTPGDLVEVPGGARFVVRHVFGDKATRLIQGYADGTLHMFEGGRGDVVDVLVDPTPPPPPGGSSE